MSIKSNSELVSQLTGKTLDDLADAMVAAAESVSEAPDGTPIAPEPKTIIKAQMEVLMSWLVANVEIKGVKVVRDVSLNTVFTAGVPVPTDGGAALQIAWKAGTAGGAADGSTQSNDGKGLIE